MNVDVGGIDMRLVYVTCCVSHVTCHMLHVNAANIHSHVPEFLKVTIMQIPDRTKCLRICVKSGLMNRKLEKLALNFLSQFDKVYCFL